MLRSLVRNSCIPESEKIRVDQCSKTFFRTQNRHYYPLIQIVLPCSTMQSNSLKQAEPSPPPQRNHQQPSAAH